MTERLSPSQEQTATRGSRSMERAWRVFTYPRRYSLDEVEHATGDLVSQKKNLEVSIQLNIGGIDPEIYDRIFMGIFHRDIPIPPELKYKDPRRN